MSKERLAYLLKKYMDDSCSPQEKDEFLLLISVSTRHQHLSELLEKAWRGYVSDLQIDKETSDRLFNNIIVPEIRSLHATPVYLRRSFWMKFAAALLLTAGTGTFFYYRHLSAVPVDPVYAIHASVQKDIQAPDNVHAVITTGSGKKIVLDHIRNGAIGSNLEKLSNDNLAYSATAQGKIEIHTLTVPQGSQAICVTLSDASKVWINAGSSLTYPTAFAGAERQVKIAGEAYFEIAHNPERPFLVVHDKAVIEVLGTHFNVNAYEDEENIKVTLLKGSVKVNSGSGKTVLIPGQQAVLTSGGAIVLNNGVNLEEVMAWKMGRFIFDNADIRAIMRQLMKWYDVEVSYEGKLPDRHFTADISRNTNLSELLKVLELSNISFEVKGKKLIVKP